MTPEDHVRYWLSKHQTGCYFAAVLAKSDLVAMGEMPPGATGGDLTAFLDLAGSQHLPAIAVLPEIRTESELAARLLAWSTADRWRIVRVPPPTGLETDDVLVGMEWTTADGLVSSPMGLAPIGTMPATRRAPYTCIAACKLGAEIDASRTIPLMAIRLPRRPINS